MWPYTFTDNLTGATCTVTLVAPHRATLTVTNHGKVLGTATVDVNYEPIFGWDVSDLHTFEVEASRIIDQ